MSSGALMQCPDCQRPMTRVGAFWVCGGHASPVVQPVEVAAVTPSTHALGPLVEQLPTPLALPVAEYAAASAPFVALHRLTDAAELITRFFAIVALTDVRRRLGAFPESLKNLLASTFSRPTFGAWRGIADAALRTLGPGAACFFVELPSYWTERWKPLIGRNDGDPGGQILALRNQLAHAGRLPDGPAAALLEQHRARFEQTLQGLQFLGEYRLIATRGEGEAPLLLRGSPRAADWALPPLPAGDYPSGLRPRRVYLLKGDASLDLFPLHSYDVVMLWREEEQAFREVDTAAPQLYLRYNDRRQMLEFTALAPRTSFAQRAEEFAREFLAVFDLAGWRRQHEATEAHHDEWERWGYAFDDLIAELTAGLVGRTGEDRPPGAPAPSQIDQAKSWVREHLPTGGVLWISGEPGVGKSAFMAELAKRLQGDSALCVIPYFFRSGDARSSAAHFYHAAMLRLSRRFGLPLDADVSASGRDQLVSLLEAVRARQEQAEGAAPVLFLLDGLDEIAGQHPELARLPLALREARLVWVCAGRREPPLADIFAAPGVGQLWENGELPPLTKHDVRALIQRECDKYELFRRDEPQAGGGYHNPFVERLVERSAGLPLYVRLVIEDLNAKRLTFWDEDELPARLRDYFERILQRLQVGDLPQMLTDVLALLCWANEPLTEAMLRDLLRPRYATGGDWESVLASAVRYGHVLLRATATPEGAWGWALYHESVRQHLRATPTIRLARERAHERLLDWCAGWHEHPHPYILRQYADHLRAARRWEALFGLARDEAFRLAQAQAFPDDPDLPLRTLRTALLGAAEADDATTMAEFLLAHARRALLAAQESPLEAVRRGSLARAWALADFYEVGWSVLWHLLLVWELSEAGKLAEARATLERLQKKGAPRLVGWQRACADALLVHALAVDEGLFIALQQRLVSDERALCQQLAAHGQVAAALRAAWECAEGTARAVALGEIALAQARAGDRPAAGKTFADAVAAAQQIDDTDPQAVALLELARLQAEAQDFAAALATAREIGDPYRRAEALRKVVAVQAAAGEIAPAVQTARGIEEQQERARALGAVAEAIAEGAATQARAGARTRARQAFADARRMTDEIEDLLTKAEALSAIAGAQAQAGDRTATAAGFAAARATIEDSFGAWDDYFVLMRIAIAQAAAGDIAASLETVQEISDGNLRVDTLVAIAAGQTRAGNRTMAARICAAAREAALGIGDLSGRDGALQSVVEEQARAGLVDEALATASAIDDEEYWIEGLGCIVKVQARMGSLAVAGAALARVHQALGEAYYDGARGAALGEIALQQTRLSDFAGALETARGIGLASARARALAAIARAWRQAGDGGAAETVFADALDAAREVHDPSRRVGVLRLIAAAQAAAGDAAAAAQTFATAIETTRTITDPLLLLDELRAIRLDIERAPVGDYAASLQAVAAIESGVIRAETIATIAAKQAEAGDQAAAERTFAVALETARQIDRGWERAQALSAIAPLQARAGDEAAAEATFGAAAAEAYQGEWTQFSDLNAQFQAQSLAKLAAAQARAGRFAAALATAQRIDRGWDRADALRGIARAQAAAGDKAAAARSFTMALEAARGSGIANHDAVVQGIAAELASAGEFTAALEAARSVHSAEVLRRIAEAQARAGEFVAAQETVTEIAHEGERATALRAIAQAAAAAGRGDDALRLAEAILVDRQKHLPEIAAALATAGHREPFKGLLVPCAYSLEGAYQMCGLLAYFYPEQASVLRAAIVADGTA